MAAYLIGGLAAFTAGASAQLLRERGIGKVWSVAAAVLVGAGISMLTIRELDIHVLPHHMGDPAPLLGSNMWYFIGCIGAVSFNLRSV
jgi:hypothetical protein